MLDPLVLIILVVVFALVFDFTNGMNDSANAIATVIGTRTLTPAKALLLAGTLNVAGAFFSTAVAKAIGTKIVDAKIITQLVVLAALLAAIVWNVIMARIGMPVSSSHGLIGALVGSAVAFKGFAVLKVTGLLEILIALLLSPLLGGLLAYGLMKLIRALFANSNPSKVKRIFRPLQIISSSLMAFSHGTNDAQKAMGIITLALVAGGYLDTVEVPTWVVIAAGLTMGLGTAIGGWRIIRTMGMRLAHLDTPHGFAAETAAAVLLTSIAKVGIPVSTTQTMTGAILGVGTAERVKSVRWGIAGKIVYAWVFTLPGTAIMAWLFYQVLKVLE
ncbi:inorganic phosphate transporter, PiT family [Marininema mesophilum]|uniref:Inorganic phosphate transporter, PiT family n=1 Tax=Marininema mesophilum TaxID=1048340 RepID=A0A1H3B3F8_9BACL|nr:inorganic phosphate transporter [Marininema mesophilum]SDX36325.1 inorganic phosphate transporter, PiT family [Marininema mesophilum]